MENHIQERLKEMGVTVPIAPARGGNYTPCKIFGNGRFVYCSGFGCNTPERSYVGKLGQEISVQEGYEAARDCMRNLLAAYRRDIGPLETIGSIVKMLALVASSDDFYDQPTVANGATDFLMELFGEEAGLPARSAIGVTVLPGNIPVEIELILERK